jgi:hypothetical protein
VGQLPLVQLRLLQYIMRRRLFTLRSRLRADGHANDFGMGMIGSIGMSKSATDLTSGSQLVVSA